MNGLVVSVIVVAAGSGQRFGYERNKLFYPLCGEPVLAHTLRHVLAAPSVQELIVVHSRQDRHDVEELTASLGGDIPVKFVLGGATRTDSVYAGLQALRDDADIVIVQDGARPYAGPEWYEQGIAAMKTADAAIYAVPLKDTVKIREDEAAAGTVLHTLDRSRLVAVQTPQLFRRSILVRAHERARDCGINGTDDASLVEALGTPVVLLEGSERNRKVTTREDIPILELYMNRPSVQRAGMGYDVHRLVTGRPLILGGVTIPFDRGLDGHSDADVLVHAVMDALLGAAGLHDIGTYFPDTDPAYEGASSIDLLRRVGTLLTEHGWTPVNIDVTLLAQRPKIKPYVPQMTEHIAQALQISAEAVAVKATTTEGLGFVGREEGMAAQAVAMVRTC